MLAPPLPTTRWKRPSLSERKSRVVRFSLRFRKREQPIRDDAQKRQLENERLTEQAVQNAEIERQEAQQRLRAADARASAAKEKQLVREAEEKIAAERAHAAKLRKFEQALPEIQSLLSPMISRGRMQLGSNGANFSGPPVRMDRSRSHLSEEPKHLS